jgi:hypothetical protein
MSLGSESVSRELKLVEQANQLEIYKTVMKKAQFINEIKTGLGDEIKTNPNKIKIIKKPFLQKVKLFFIKMFTKF